MDIILYIALGYILLGIIAIVLIAYDPYSNSFDFDLGDGFVHPAYVMFLTILGGPFYFVLVVIKRITEIPSAIQWKKTGSYSKKIK